MSLPKRLSKRNALKRLALLMAVNCVRNTVIEDYHSDGKIVGLGDEDL